MKEMVAVSFLDSRLWVIVLPSVTTLTENNQAGKLEGT